MTLSVLTEKAVQPGEPDVSAVLDGAKLLWDQVRALVPGSLEQWKHYGKQSGWTLLLKRKSRTILYLFPGNQEFVVLFVFSEKAVAAAEGAGLPEPVLAKIREAQPYMEGRSFQLRLPGEADVEVIRSLLAIKLMN